MTTPLSRQHERREQLAPKMTYIVVKLILPVKSKAHYLLARDHAIFTSKIASELILITHFTNLILGTIKCRARYTLRLSYAFFQYLL